MTDRTGKRTRRPPPPTLPDPFGGWFAGRGWQPREHQLAMLDRWRERRNTLLIAPTGAGKTLAGFLPSLLELAAGRAGRGLHTLYVSPLKALTVDIARNLSGPVAEMALPVRLETRTGDTPHSRRARQTRTPPDILLTTPEQVALLLAQPDMERFFADLRAIVLDELHALAGSKRGDLLALDLARLRRLAPDATAFGLSATVARPSELAAYLEPQRPAEEPAHIRLADIVHADGGTRPAIRILESGERLPWSGHSARYAFADVYREIARHRLALVFVNTRSQAEMDFQGLWEENEDGLPIALHHGSLDVGQRRKVEAAMAAGKLRAVVCTSTLDLGIDWGDVDLVVHVGAPKGSSRLLQRIGRANHRMDEPSSALLVPANRFEVLECRAALEAAEEGAQDTILERKGTLDVLAQHVLGMACAGPFDPADLFAEITSALPYSCVTRAQFDRVVAFVGTGGYALSTYDRFAKLRPLPDGRLRLSHPRFAQQYRMNMGTIVDAPMFKVRLGRIRKGHAGGAPGRPGEPGATLRAYGGRVLGEVDEWFISQLTPGDTFAFAGEILRFEGLVGTEAIASRTTAGNVMIPTYQGGKFPLTTSLAERVRAMLADQTRWAGLPDQVRHWLDLQRQRSLLPGPGEVLVETFPRGGRHYLVCYPFEGRLAHQTLGVLVTRRLERAGARPLGFVATDYALGVWCLGDLGAMTARGELALDAIFAVDMLGDDLEDWLARSSIMRRTFHICAVIAGLIERRHPGREKSGRQMVLSTDLVYDVLRRHEPDHILIEAAWADAATGLLDLGRLNDFLTRIEGHIRHVALGEISPLSVPIMLEVGRESVSGEARDELLRQAAAALSEEVTRGVDDDASVEGDD
ncbi:MAG: ligase-associated DNA damage response DEXH box helicase [Rhizobiales bacterium]|nr:ligase-associated DNA damage response DEXH box helicase [Hyphomicrobiales bacterium]